MGESERESRFVELLTDVQLPLLCYVRSLLPGDPGARDVAQHANSTLWRKRADFELGTNFKAWAFSVARFEVLNYRKQQARDARFVFSEELEKTMAEEMARSEEDLQERQDALQRCLGKLKPKDRDLILHRYSNSGTLRDYAEVCGRSVGGLKVTLHRLRNALLECIRGKLENREVSA